METPWKTIAMPALLAVSLLGCHAHSKTQVIPVVALPAPVDSFRWPHGAKAAVTLTYDDALDSQFAFVAPDLQQRGLHGTFFVLGENIDGENMAEWREVSAEGNELASHTITHPCQDAEAARFTASQMNRELDDSVVLLKQLTGKPGPFNFAYPCGERMFGPPGRPIDYSALVSRRFPAARVAGGIIMDPLHDPLDAVPGITPDLPFEDHDGSSLIERVRQAEQRGGWIVFIFHAVGERDGYRPTSREAHAQLIDYLAQNREAVWTGTFAEVSSYITAKRRNGGSLPMQKVAEREGPPR